MLYSILQTRNCIKVKNQLLIPLEYTKKLLKEVKTDVGEIAINNIPDVPIWDSKPVTVDFTLSEFDKSSTSTIFKSRFNELRQKYSDFCRIYTDRSKVERKVVSAYVCPHGTRSYRLRDGCSIFTVEVEAIDKALKYVKVSSVERFVIFSDSMSVLQAIESQESKNPLVNRVLQTYQEILSNGKFITFCWIPSHRDIRGNEDADRAAKDALSKAQSAHLNYHVHMFLLRSSLLSHLCGRNGGIKRLVTNCTPSCPKLMKNITRDAQIEKMKLLSLTCMCQ